jgi:hypothetical protein
LRRDSLSGPTSGEGAGVAAGVVAGQFPFLMIARVDCIASPRACHPLIVLGVALCGLLAPSATGAQALRGVVYDSLFSRGPLVGASVVVEGFAQAATTDRRGRFALEGIAEGTHLLTFHHPALDSARVSAPIYRVTVPRGGLRNLQLSTPSFATTSEFLCGTTLDAASTIVLGRVRAVEDGRPLAGATARVEWWEFSFGGEGGAQHLNRELSVQADTLGEFRLCGVPTDVDLTLRVRLGSQQSGHIAFPEQGQPITIRDIAVSLTDGAASVAADSAYTADPAVVRAGLARLRVLVRDDRDRPIENAVVGIRGHGASGASNARGEVLIRTAPSGSQSVVVRAVGRAPVTQVVALAPNQETALELRLSEVAALLPEYRVTGIRENPVVTGYERRKRAGVGTFLEAEQLDRIGRQAAALAGIGGLRVPFVADAAGGTRYPVVQFRNAEGNFCTPSFFVDGIPLQRLDGWELHTLLQLADRVEIYRRGMTVPAEFAAGGFQCGTVAIWTTR